MVRAQPGAARNRRPDADEDVRAPRGALHPFTLFTDSPRRGERRTGRQLRVGRRSCAAVQFHRGLARLPPIGLGFE